MIVTPAMIAAAGRAAAARGLPGIPPEIIRAMLDAVINPPEGDDLPPVPLGVVTVYPTGDDARVIKGVVSEEPAEITVTVGSPYDKSLELAFHERRAIRYAEGRGRRAKVSFWLATRRDEDGDVATYRLERAV